MEYDYVPLPDRGRLAWPGDARLALILTFNLETWDLVKESERAYYAGGPSILPDALPGNVPDFPNYTWREYGQRIGIWRLIELFDELGVAASCTTNAVTFQRRKAMTDAILARGWELITHNWEQGELLTDFAKDPAAERAVILRDARRVREASRTQVERVVVLLAQEHARHCRRARGRGLPVLLRHHERRSAVHDPDRERADRLPAIFQRDQ